jgi:hypothetical protein
MLLVGPLCSYGTVTIASGDALLEPQSVTGREPVTATGAGAAGTGGVCVGGAGGVVGGGVVGGVLAQVQSAAGVVGVPVGVPSGVVDVGVGSAPGHFTQNTFCLAAPFSPVKFQKSL